MMLYSIDDKVSPITHIPHEKDYLRWRARLTNDEYAGIEAELLERVGSSDIVTSSWIPGNDWAGTPFEPIYIKACEYDEVASGLCFGLFFWVYMQKHPGKWSFGRYKKDGIDIRGLTYFKIEI
jgi:hypothetical protein